MKFVSSLCGLQNHPFCHSLSSPIPCVCVGCASLALPQSISFCFFSAQSSWIWCKWRGWFCSSPFSPQIWDTGSQDNFVYEGFLIFFWSYCYLCVDNSELCAVLQNCEYSQQGGQRLYKNKGILSFPDICTVFLICMLGLFSFPYHRKNRTYYFIS